MDDLQVLKLVRCETCGSFVRDDAAYCFTCRNKSTEDQPKVKPKDLNALKQLESREQERRSREFQSLVQLALAKAPWRLLIRRYIHPFQEPEIQSAAREWVNADGSRPVEFPQPGWLKDIVRRMQPDDSQLDCLMRDVILMDTLLSVRAGNEWMLSDREQMLTEGFEILSEHTACPSENNPIASLLEVTRTRFAYQLCLLLDETNRSAEAEEYRTAARVSDVHLPQVNQTQVKDSSGAIYFKPGPDPDNPSMWSWLGDMCAERKLYAEALIWYRRRLTYCHIVNNPDRLTIIHRIGKLLINCHDYAGAEPYLEEYLEQYSNPFGSIPFSESYLRSVSPSEIYFQLAVVKSAVGKHEEANSCYKRAVSLLELEKPEARSNLGEWERRYVTVLQSYLPFLEREQLTNEEKKIRAKLEPYTKRKVIIY